MYYYLTVSYNITDLCMEETSELVGPFETAEKRQEHLAKDLGERDLETSEIVSVTLLMLEGLSGSVHLIAEHSYVTDDEGNDPDAEDLDEDEEIDYESC